MRIPYHGTPPISGKLTDLLRAFNTNIHTLSSEHFPFDSLPREHEGDPYSYSPIYFILFYFLRAREYYVYVFYPNPRGPYIPQ